MSHLTLCSEVESPFGLKVQRALRAEGLPFHTLRERMTNAFIVHESEFVPVVLLDGEPVNDSTAVLEHIADALLPRDARACAEAWLWEEFADRSLNPYVLAAYWADDRNWAAVRQAFFGKSWFERVFVAPFVRARRRAGIRARGVGSWGDFRRLLDHLESRAPLRGCWVSEQPSVADVAIFAQLAPLRSSLTPWQAREIQLRPALTDWLDRIDEHTRYTRLPAICDHGSVTRGELDGAPRA